MRSGRVIAELRERIQTLEASVTMEVSLSSSNPNTKLELSLNHSETRMLDDYFLTFNTVLPLFDRECLMDAYERQTRCICPYRNDITAAVNMALAMAHLTRSLGSQDYTLDKQHAVTYFGRAFHLLPELRQSNQTSLLDIAALLAMVLVLQGMHDTLPGSVVLASGIWMALQLRLHRLDCEENRIVSGKQCRRLFWLVYILDKDNCLLLA